MPEPSRGLPDTSVVVDHDVIDVGLLPEDSAISTAGRPSRARPADLLMASTAFAHGLPLHTRTRDGFTGLESLVSVVRI